MFAKKYVSEDIAGKSKSNIYSESVDAENNISSIFHDSG